VLNFIKWLFSERSNEQDRDYKWLCSSTSLEEIERRQRMLSRGEAPWQINARRNVTGWI
jgi:hypothetical protein|tara:strand:- start:539 stop:715 length:177 start_codon:yes stop_codon:yes gene_type:complete